MSCSFDCKHNIKRLANGDGCCPGEGNANNDTDCKAKCGNNVTEDGETCEGNCPSTCDDNDFCTDDAMTGFAASCNVVCTHAHHCA